MWENQRALLLQIKAALAGAHLSLVLLALVAYALSLPLVAWRWRVALEGVTKNRAPLSRLLLASMAASFVNNVTPAARLSGEVCRVVALLRMRLATLEQAGAAAAYERLSEIPALALLVVASLWAFGQGTLAIEVALATLLVVGVIALVMRGAIDAWWRRIMQRWHRLESVRITRPAFVTSAALSAAVWGLDIVRLTLVAHAFTAPIGLLQAAMLATISIVAGLVPTVGGLGAVEGGLVAGLMAFGTKGPDAIAITVVERGISYGISTMIGAGALSLLGGRSLWTAVRVRRHGAEVVKS